MPNPEEQNHIFLYPLRESALVDQPNFLKDVDPLPFTEEERGEIREFVGCVSGLQK